MQVKPRVLFVCDDNAIHSRIAQSCLERLQGHRYDAHSAGFVAAPANEATLATLERIGYAVRAPGPQPTVYDLHDANASFDYVFDLRPAAAQPPCPVFPGVLRQLRWRIDTPTRRSTAPHDDAWFDATRDAILLRVTSWVMGRHTLRRLPGEDS